MKTLQDLLLKLNSAQKDILYFALENMLRMGTDSADDLILYYMEEIENEEE